MVHRSSTSTDRVVCEAGMVTFLYGIDAAAEASTEPTPLELSEGHAKMTTNYQTVPVTARVSIQGQSRLPFRPRWCSDTSDIRANRVVVLSFTVCEDTNVVLPCKPIIDPTFEGTGTKKRNLHTTLGKSTGRIVQRGSHRP